MYRRNRQDSKSGEVVTIEYDPDGSADICLVHCRDGEKTLTLHPFFFHFVVPGAPTYIN
jgi:ribosomal protein L2